MWCFLWSVPISNKMLNKHKATFFYSQNLQYNFDLKVNVGLTLSLLCIVLANLQVNNNYTRPQWFVFFFWSKKIAILLWQVVMNRRRVPRICAYQLQPLGHTPISQLAETHYYIRAVRHERIVPAQSFGRIYKLLMRICWQSFDQSVIGVPIQSP